MNTILFTVDEHDIALLKNKWDALLSFYTPDKSIKDASFQILKEKYSEESRFYHNLSHVKMLLDLLESINHKVLDPRAIQFAIWFHDVIYDPKRIDNEEQSARLASDMLQKLHVDSETIRYVDDLILATKGHRGHSLTEDAKFFLDMDLAILGMSKGKYKQYSHAIREEYAWVPEPRYRKSRIEILESFIRRERIYATDVMKKRFEEQARNNIHAEIELLAAS